MTDQTTVEISSEAVRDLDRINSQRFSDKLEYSQLIGWLARQQVVEDHDGDVTLGGNLIESKDTSTDKGDA